METALDEIISRIIGKDVLHAKWLNSLSYMENCGAKKIAKCQHPFLVTEEILKHASEEFRHGYYLKKQIKKVTDLPFTTFEANYILAPRSTKYYIQNLDIMVCRFLKKGSLCNVDDLRYVAYLLVTYAIEIRAERLYPIYQRNLSVAKSRVQVQSIIVEEIEHLKEISASLNAFFNDAQAIMSRVKMLEEEIFQNWLSEVIFDIENSEMD